MDSKTKKALEKAEETVARANKEEYSRQPRITDPATTTQFFASVMRWYKSDLAKAEPEYQADTRARDEWLDRFWRQEPHLSGIVNSVVSIDSNRDWTLVGGRNQVIRYSTILRNVEDGDGWRSFMSLQSNAFYASNLGAIAETGRDGQGGPLRALYHVDPIHAYMTGDRRFPLRYTPKGGEEQDWTDDDFFRVVSLQSGKEGMNGAGFCAVDRAVQLTKLMLAVYGHHEEMLGARAPKGLLLLRNVTEEQWTTAMGAREEELSNRQREYYGGIGVLASVGEEDIDAKLLALSQLPAGFNLETFVNLLMYGYALCFGYDPIEFWPVSAGALGRGRETEIQNEKATGKGGLAFIAAYQDRMQMQLPDTVDFEFLERDDEGDLKRAEVVAAWGQAVSTLIAAGITEEEARHLLADSGVIPAEWADITEDEKGSEVRSRRKEQRDRRLDSIRVQRAIANNPDEEIVEFHHNGKTGRGTLRTLRKSGQRLSWRVVESPQLTQRQEDSTLFAEDDVEITEADVDEAISQARRRVGDEFADLLENQPLSPEEVEKLNQLAEGNE